MNLKFSNKTFLIACSLVVFACSPVRSKTSAIEPANPEDSSGQNTLEGLKVFLECKNGGKLVDPNGAEFASQKGTVALFQYGKAVHLSMTSDFTKTSNSGTALNIAPSAATNPTTGSGAVTTSSGSTGNVPTSAPAASTPQDIELSFKLEKYTVQELVRGQQYTLTQKANVTSPNASTAAASAAPSTGKVYTVSCAVAETAPQSDPAALPPGAPVGGSVPANDGSSQLPPAGQPGAGNSGQNQGTTGGAGVQNPPAN